MSDSMNGPSDVVVGTAGHIDHGKTSLVYALTGMDTDRLREEKRRGISIDLGFAHMPLPSGATASFIDVPGHERFIRNMLAGAAGIQAVMLTVAADESVMPQTREHFEICRLLNVQAGFVVLTKVDLATPEQIAITCEDVEELCAGSFLEGAAVVQVSSRDRRGIPEVVRQLDLLAGRVSHPGGEGIPRLPVDRSFSLKGFGTVVTGTLAGGLLRAGDKVFIHPARKEAEFAVCRCTEDRSRRSDPACARRSILQELRVRRLLGVLCSQPVRSWRAHARWMRRSNGLPKSCQRFAAK
ncbi:MAG: hypothetical protein JOZ62_18840 [Acidobacteriaceae bacterium]|nr:hypothetical protein [Acidobacteriaceae bacterium]